jgi:hypothetical protein
MSQQKSIVDFNGDNIADTASLSNSGYTLFLGGGKGTVSGSVPASWTVETTEYGDSLVFCNLVFKYSTFAYFVHPFHGSNFQINIPGGWNATFSQNFDGSGLWQDVFQYIAGGTGNVHYYFAYDPAHTGTSHDVVLPLAQNSTNVQTLWAYDFDGNPGTDLAVYHLNGSTGKTDIWIWSEQQKHLYTNTGLIPSNWNLSYAKDTLGLGRNQLNFVWNFGITFNGKSGTILSYDPRLGTITVH